VSYCKANYHFVHPDGYDMVIRLRNRTVGADMARLERMAVVGCCMEVLPAALADMAERPADKVVASEDTEPLPWQYKSWDP